MKKLTIILFMSLSFLTNWGQQSTSGYLFFNENRGISAARNWAIRQNNTHEGDLQIGTGGTNTSGLPDFYTSQGFAKVTISNSGNVGIGTTNPQTKLEVYGGRLTQQGAIANDNNAVFVNTDATGYGIYSK